MKFAVAAILLQCIVGAHLASVQVATKTYGTYTMTHAATSAGVYSSGTTNTYNGGSTTYYPQGAAVTYQQACTVYYPSTTTVNTGSGGSYTYGAGSYVNYPAGAQVSYQPGATCFFPKQTSCTYGSYNGASSCAVRYPASTYVSCYSPSQPTYYAPGTYSAGVQYPNYNFTGKTTYSTSNGYQYSSCNVGYTQQGYPINYVTNQSTGQTSCVTQTGSSSYISYSNGAVSSGSNMYG